MVKFNEVNFLSYSGEIPANEANLTTALATAVGNLTPFARQVLGADVETQMNHFAPLAGNGVVHPFLFTSVGCAVNALDRCAKKLDSRVHYLQDYRVLNTGIQVSSGVKPVFDILNENVRAKLSSRYNFGEITPAMFNDPVIKRNLTEDAPLFALVIGSIFVGLQEAHKDQDRWNAMRREQARDFGIQAHWHGNHQHLHVPLDEAHGHAQHGGCIADLGEMCIAMKDAPSALKVWDGKSLAQTVSKSL